MDIAVVGDGKAIREHICALIEEQKPGRIRRGTSLQGMLGMSFRFWHPLAITLETAQPWRRTDFSNTRLPGDSKHLVAVKKGKSARLYLEFREMQDGVMWFR